MMSWETPIQVINAQRKIWDWERSGIIRRIYLLLKGKKPKPNEYNLVIYYPMSEEFYKIFPHNKYSKVREVGL